MLMFSGESRPVEERLRCCLIGSAVATLAWVRAKNPFTKRAFGARSARFVAVALLGVGHFANAYPATQAQLDAALARWKSHAPANYSYSLSISAIVFSMPCQSNADVRLTLHNGRVTSGVYLNAGAPGRSPGMQITANCLSEFYTIDHLFETLKRYPVGDIDVKFDPVYGYPTLIQVGNLLDGDFPIKIWDFVVQ